MARFGGHQTFSIREGWLHKGLNQLMEDPDCLVDDYVSDYLGVGKNMSKALLHWLKATGLAKTEGSSRSKKNPLRYLATDFGRLVHEHDKYFLAPGTWWAIHVNLVNNADEATSWRWFFNDFNLTRFDRAVCVEGIRRHLQMSKGRMPSVNTLRRDINCMLRSYAQEVPHKERDPEEARDCPLTELGLLTHFRHSGQYQLDRESKRIPPELVAYALTTSFPALERGTGMADVEIFEAARAEGGPGRAFVLTSESLFEVLLQAEDNVSSSDVGIGGLAGERTVRFKRKPASEWMRDYYRRTM